MKKIFTFGWMAFVATAVFSVALFTGCSSGGSGGSGDAGTPGAPGTSQPDGPPTEGKPDDEPPPRED